LINRGKIIELELQTEIIDEAEKYLKRYRDEMINNQLDVGLKIAIELAGLGNKLLSEKEPWRNLNDPNNRNLVVTLLPIALQAIKMLEPFTPSTIKDFLTNKVGIQIDRLDLLNDLDYAKNILEKLLKSITSLEKIKPLFKKVRKEELDKARKMLEVSKGEARINPKEH